MSMVLVVCIVIAAAAVLAIWRRRQNRQIQQLAEYLEKVNTGNPETVLENREGELSKLQDEIYKTVTSLYETRDAALDARRRYADNLYNIAHQLKTPITSLSLSLQMMREQRKTLTKGRIVSGRELFSEEEALSEKRPTSGKNLLDCDDELAKMELQLSRLTHLEESLLLLARVDSGTLPLEPKDVDVFTLLMLAADNLQEFLKQKKVTAEVPELGAVRICADLEWTMEAVMNLLKNCGEHSPEGSVIHCHYEQNPIYTQIRIWDNGNGFAAEDLPHLFERFYRGENEKGNGIGIGLALAKEITELQNGTLRAFNLPEGGACFEIHFYCH